MTAREDQIVAVLATLSREDVESIRDLRVSLGGSYRAEVGGPLVVDADAAEEATRLIDVLLVALAAQRIQIDALRAERDTAEERGAIAMRDTVAESMRRAADEVSADLPGLAATGARDLLDRCDAVVRTTKRYEQIVQALDAAEVCRAARARDAGASS